MFYNFQSWSRWRVAIIVLNAFLVFVLKIVDPKTRDEKTMTIYVDNGFHPNASLYDLGKLRRAFKKRGSTTGGI